MNIKPPLAVAPAGPLAMESESEGIPLWVLVLIGAAVLIFMLIKNDKNN